MTIVILGDNWDEYTWTSLHSPTRVTARTSWRWHYWQGYDDSISDINASRQQRNGDRGLDLNILLQYRTLQKVRTRCIVAYLWVFTTKYQIHKDTKLQYLVAIQTHMCHKKESRTIPKKAQKRQMQRKMIMNNKW